MSGVTVTDVKHAHRRPQPDARSARHEVVTTWKLAGLGDLDGDGKDDVVLRDVSTTAANKGRWMVRVMNGATSVAAKSGVATSLTKVEAWDVAAREVNADTDYTLTLTVTDDDTTPLSTSASIVVTVVNRLATASCSTTDPNASSYPAWSATVANYTGGDQVSHQGLVWEAEHWTTEEPTITATDWPQEWTLLSAIELKWHPERVYLTDDEADHGTLRYRAKWWNQNKNPAEDTDREYWTAPIGPATCP